MIKKENKELYRIDIPVKIGNEEIATDPELIAYMYHPCSWRYRHCVDFNIHCYECKRNKLLNKENDKKYKEGQIYTRKYKKTHFDPIWTDYL